MVHIILYACMGSLPSVPIIPLHCLLFKLLLVLQFHLVCLASLPIEGRCSSQYSLVFVSLAELNKLLVVVFQKVIVNS